MPTTQELLRGGRFDEILWRATRASSASEQERAELHLHAAMAAQHLGLWPVARDHALRWAENGAHVATGPLVSVIIPTRDRREFLRRALASVASQLYRPIEAVVVNDAGESVSEIIDEFRPEIAVVEVVNEANLYLAASRNVGIDHASGFYLGYLDDDDLLYPHHVGHLVGLLRNHPARAAHSIPHMHSPDTESASGATLEPFSFRPFTWFELLQENVIPVQAVLHEASLVKEVGGFDRDLRANEDWEFWIRLRHATAVEQSPLVTSCVDLRHERERMTTRSLTPFLDAHEAVYRKYREKSLAVGGAELVGRQRRILSDLSNRVDEQAADRAPGPAESGIAPPLVVLGYHRVLKRVDDDPFGLAVSQENFESHLDLLSKRFRIIRGSEIGRRETDDDPRPRLLITFDDGYRDNYTTAFPVLWKRGVPAVLFASTGHIGGELPFWWEALTRSRAGAEDPTRLQQEWRFLSPDERIDRLDKLDGLDAETRADLGTLAATWPMLEEMHGSGLVEIGAHTRFHSSLGRLHRGQVEAEIRGSVEDLQGRLGVRPRLFAFPHGSPEDISDEVVACLVESGFEYAFSTVPGVIEAARLNRPNTAEVMTLPRQMAANIPAGRLVAELETRLADERASAEPFSPRARRHIVVLSGITANNLGDDAMLVATVQDLESIDPEADLTVLAEDPSRCGPVAEQIDHPIDHSLQLFVQAFLAALPDGDDPSAAVLELAREILRNRPALLRGERPAWLPEEYVAGLTKLLTADGVVDCGGANLTVHWKSFFYEKCLDYLLSPRPLLVSGQGIDRFELESDRALLIGALSKATELTVRERVSERYLRSIGCEAPLRTTGDDALTLEPSPSPRVRMLLSLAGVDPDRPFLAFQYRHYLDYQEDRFYDRFAAFVDEAIRSTGLPVVGVPMHFAGTDERGHLAELGRRLTRAEGFHIVRSHLTPADARGIFEAAAAAFGISYHSAILALAGGTPYLGLYRGEHYTQKMRGLSELYELPDLAVAVDDTPPEEFGRRLVDQVERRRTIRELLLAKQEERSREVRASRRRFMEQVRPSVRREPVSGSSPRPRARPVDWSNLRNLEPVSRNWGFDRGLPVDRFYIERFLDDNRERIRGTVCELLGDDYARRFGGDRVSRVEILDIDPANPRSTLVDDLTRPEKLEEGMFDCFILTQTLPYIYDCGAALRNAYRSLRPGGTLLITAPSIIKYHREPEDHWRFTPDSMARLITENCRGAESEVRSHGNLLTAVGFLHGMAVEDFDGRELERDDPEYPLVVTARVIRGAAGRSETGEAAA